MKNHTLQKIASIRHQNGAVLVFCLVFLTVLTLMGTSGMESTTLEERMSANMVDHEAAFAAAESALQAGEAWLIQQTLLPTTSDDGTTTVWSEDSPDPDPNDSLFWWDHGNVNSSWWSSNGDAISGVAKVADQPRYLIEQYKLVDNGESIAIGSGETTVPRYFHRITASGVGLNPNTRVSVQATFVQSYE